MVELFYAVFFEQCVGVSWCGARQRSGQLAHECQQEYCSIDESKLNTRILSAVVMFYLSI